MRVWYNIKEITAYIFNFIIKSLTSVDIMNYIDFILLLLNLRLNDSFVL